MQKADLKCLPEKSRWREKSTFLGDAVIHGFVVRNPTLEVCSRRGHLNSYITIAGVCRGTERCMAS